MTSGGRSWGGGGGGVKSLRDILPPNHETTPLTQCQYTDTRERGEEEEEKINERENRRKGED
jgi:hypothetical protein